MILTKRYRVAMVLGIFAKLDFCKSVDHYTLQLTAVSLHAGLEGASTALDLHATASAADLCSSRCLDDKTLKSLADAIGAPEGRDSNLHACRLRFFKGRPAAPEETFARFQAGLLAIHRISWIFFFDFSGFS